MELKSGTGDVKLPRVTPTSVVIDQDSTPPDKDLLKDKLQSYPGISFQLTDRPVTPKAKRLEQENAPRDSPNDSQDDDDPLGNFRVVSVVVGKIVLCSLQLDQVLCNCKSDYLAIFDVYAGSFLECIWQM